VSVGVGSPDFNRLVAPSGGALLPARDLGRKYYRDAVLGGGEMGEGKDNRAARKYSEVGVSGAE